MTDAMAAALASGGVRLGVFLRLETPAPLRIWMGVGDCPARVDATDGGGETYYGFGEVIAVPAFQQLVNGQADRVEFSLSGVSQRVDQLASGEAGDVRGAYLRVGVAAFDRTWALIEQPTWLRTFVADYLTRKRDNSEGEAVYTIAISARSLFTGRRRPALSFWNDKDQQARSPGDEFCERTSLYSVDVSKAWPRLA